MILVSAGHYTQARGAVFKDFAEFPETLSWAMRINHHLRELEAPSLLVPPGHLSRKVKYINEVHKSTGVSMAVEVHFNANDKGGSETLYCPGSIKGRRIAGVVQTALSGVFQPCRGVKEGWYQMDRPGIVDYHGDIDGDEVIDYFLRATHCPAIILEPEFVHNRDLIEARREEACRVIAEALFTARKELGHG
jgi:hypothetical protein